MGLFERFPYTNFHEMNTAWIIQKMKELEDAWNNFSAGNALTFADPLLYDATKSYAKNTIVLDANGNAYVSLKAVSAGIGLNNTEYWLMVFDYEAFLEKVNKNFTGRYYRDENRAKTAMAIGDWLTFDDVLCKVTAAIAADDILEVGVNIEHFTIEDFLKDFTTSLTQAFNDYKTLMNGNYNTFTTNANNTINQYKNDIDASELAYKNELQALFNAAVAGTTVDSEVILAREGANGVTYPTLGEAIRTMDTIIGAQKYRDLVTLEWELNGINASGQDTTNQYSIRTKGGYFYHFESGDFLIVTSNISLIAFKYTFSSSGYTYDSRDIGISAQSYNLDPNYYYRFAISTIPTATLTDTTAADYFNCFAFNLSKAAYEEYQVKAGTIKEFNITSYPGLTVEGTLPTNWFINLDSIVPMHSLIKSIKFKSAVAAQKHIQIGLFRRLAKSSGDDSYLELVDLIDYEQMLVAGVNEVPINAYTHSQIYIGIRPLSGDFLQFNRGAAGSGYGYYSFTNNDWITPDPLNLSYSQGCAELLRGNMVHRAFECYEVDYYFKPTPYVGKKVAVIGDSIQTNSLYRTYYEWYELLTAELGFTVVQYASGGRAYDPSQGGGTGFNQYVGRVNDEVYEPDAIIIFGGINDYAGSAINLGTINSGANPYSEYGCMKLTYNTLQTYFPYTPVLIVSPTPICVDDGSGTYVNALGINNTMNYNMQDLVTAMKELCEVYHLYFFDATNHSPLNPELGGTANPLYRGDYTHPSTDGHELIAAQLRCSVEQILKATPDSDDYFSSPWL